MVLPEGSSQWASIECIGDENLSCFLVWLWSSLKGLRWEGLKGDTEVVVLR